MIERLLGGQSATFRITMGLSGMVMSLLLVASVLGLLPDSRAIEDQGRARLAEMLAVNTSVFITSSDLHRLETTLDVMVKRNDDILSAGVRKKNGESIVDIGFHDDHWVDADETPGQIRVPLWEGKSKWGELEMRFEPHGPGGWQDYFYHPIIHLVTFMTLSGLVVFFFYLRSMLKQLDPSQAIPGRVRSTLDTMAEGLLVLDAKQNIMLANEAFAVFAGTEPDDLVGHLVGNFPWTDEAENLLEPEQTPWGRALKTASAQMRDRVKLDLGEHGHWTFLVNCSPVLAKEGKAAGVLISFDDVTELEQKEIELQKSKDEADAANQSKSEFLANMSHEIRTPMNAILGFTEVLRRGYGKTKDSSQYLDTISTSGNHLLTLINDILDLSKVEAGHIEVEETACRPDSIIREVMQIMQVKADEKDILLSFEPDGLLPKTISTDISKLRQIITNLVGNAIKFTNEGGITIIARFIEDGPDSLLGIDVTDTGIGLNSEQIDKVFDSFVQADSSITRRFGGTGLGLPISKSYAEAMGGDILVSSEVGKGSTFAVTIRTGQVDEAQMLTLAELMVDDPHEDIADQSWTFPPAKVLIVDDGEENRMLLDLVLHEAGLVVEQAENGAEALDMVSAGTFEVILMDIQMPVMDGYTAVAKMREQGITTPVIALTAHAMKGSEDRCLEAGYTGYLPKPINIDNLLKYLTQYIDGATTKAHPSQTSGEDVNLSKSDGVSPKKSVGKGSAIRPELPIDTPKVRELARRFTIRLGEQLLQMRTAATNQDQNELTEIAHWLKGSAGTVGFHDFTLPSARLEKASRDGDMQDVNQQLKILEDLFDRIDVDGEKPEGDFSCETSYHIPEVVTSDLLNQNPKFYEITNRFVVRLGSQIEEMKQAAAKSDHEALAALGHWLKGSGGSVGFNVFTEPGAQLEQSARNQQEEEIGELIAWIEALYERIHVPHPDSQLEVS